ncbi:MAG: hypothetical protein H2069_07790 [Legionella sp.]|nr:hypothetical protein [Legionella sp.]
MIYKFFHAKDLEINPDHYQNLTLAIEEYMNAISQGNYLPQIPPNVWNIQEELQYINQLLLPTKPYIKFPPVPKVIPTPIKFTLPAIANLLATLSIWHGTRTSKVIDLTLLEQLGLNAFVKAGMPGPSLIYLDTLINDSEYDNLSKLFLLGELITDITNQHETFGSLVNFVLITAIQAWFHFIKLLTDKEQKAFYKEHYHYKSILKAHFSENKKSVTSFLDKCIERLWEKLGIKITIDNSTQETCSNSAMKKNTKTLMGLSTPCTLSL